MINRTLYLEKLLSFRDKPEIKVITGVRRCGKSSLLHSFAMYLRKEGVEESNIIEMNFEDMQYDGIDYKTLHIQLTESLKKSKTGKKYVFLDEIQRVDSWEKVANSLILNKNVDLYLTGSNAHILSSELSTFLSGRYVEVKMLPLSFKEFLDFYTFEAHTTTVEKFKLYMQFGGMPSLAKYNFYQPQSNEMLDSIYNTVLMKDVIAKENIKDIQTLQKVVRFLANNVGSETSINNITQVLMHEKSISYANNKLIEAYINRLTNAFIFYKVGRYDIKGKDILRTREKYYIVDSGLRTFLMGRMDDIGHLLENIVYFELLRRGYQVFIGKIGDKEIDFIASKSEEKIYFQVSETVAGEETRTRELTPLQMVKDNFEKILLTTDTLFTGTTEDGIKIINVMDWLLNEV